MAIANRGERISWISKALRYEFTHLCHASWLQCWCWRKKSLEMSGVMQLGVEHSGTRFVFFPLFFTYHRQEEDVMFHYDHSQLWLMVTCSREVISWWNRHPAWLGWVPIRVSMSGALVGMAPAMPKYTTCFGNICPVSTSEVKSFAVYMGDMSGFQTWNISTLGWHPQASLHSVYLPPCLSWFLWPFVKPCLAPICYLSSESGGSVMRMRRTVMFWGQWCCWF